MDAAGMRVDHCKATPQELGLVAGHPSQRSPCRSWLAESANQTPIRTLTAVRVVNRCERAIWYDHWTECMD